MAYCAQDVEVEVTPHAGVWIETLGYGILLDDPMSRPMRACGLKREQQTKQRTGTSHAPCGRVD